MGVISQGGRGTDAPWSAENRRFQIMSEGLQQQRQHHRTPRNMRTERTTTSCGECRRRKQKCDQQQPCGNCQRRFPQPVCEYRVGNRIPGTSSFPTPTRAGGRVPAPGLPGSTNPIDQTPTQHGHSIHPGLSWRGIGIASSFSSSDTDPKATNISPGDRSWSPEEPHNAAHVSSSLLKMTWGDSHCRLDSDPFQASLQVLTFRRAYPNAVLGAGNDGEEDEWTPEDEIIPIYWPPSARVRLHHPIGNMEDQFGHLPVAQTPLNKKLLRIYLTILSRFKGSLTGDPDPSNPFVKHYAPFCLQDPLVVQTIMYASACYLHETSHLPRTAWMATKGRAIQTLNNRISSGQNRSAVNVGGDGTSDPAIASVVQLTGAEWYWGETEDVQRHLRGLRDMIRLRGGLDKLGMNGILAKNAICHDVSITLAHENSPLLPLQSPEAAADGGASAWAADYAFVDPIKDVPLRMSHFAPSVHGLPSTSGSLPTFTDCAQALGIHRATASILDNVRFLFRAVEAAYTAASETMIPTAKNTTTTTTGDSANSANGARRRASTKAASRKTQLTGKFIYEHISGLHPTIPGHRQSSPSVSTRGNSPGSEYFAGSTEEWSTRGGSISSLGGSGGPGRPPLEPASDPTTTPEWLSAADARDSQRDSGPTVAAPHCQQQQHQQEHQQQHVQQPQSPDYMYQIIRATAIIYSRAIMNRTPLSTACTTLEFLQIWATTWRVSLSTWNGAVGIFHWIMLAIAPASLATPHGRFVKNMLMVSTNSLGIGNWAILMGAAKANMRLQHWLRGQQGAEGEDEEQEG